MQQSHHVTHLSNNAVIIHNIMSTHLIQIQHSYNHVNTLEHGHYVNTLESIANNYDNFTKGTNKAIKTRHTYAVYRPLIEICSFKYGMHALPIAP